MALWASLTVSEVGSQVTQLALPLAAISTLRSGSSAVGLLRAFDTLPFLLLGLPAGVWVGSRRRRSVMLAADGMRLAVLGSLPVAYALGDLTLAQMYVAALVAGVGTVLFDVAYQSYLPQIIGRTQLLEGNAKLGLSQSVAQVGGPGIAGVLVGMLGPPVAVAVDAASFLASAAGIAMIRRPEARPRPPAQRGSMASEVRAGLRYVLGHRILKHLAGCTATANFGLAMIDTVLVVFLARTLHLDAGRIGLVFVLGGTGVVAGAIAGGASGRRLGVGLSCWGGIAVAAAGGFLAPMAPGRPSGMWLVAASQWLVMFGGTAFNVNQVALRQAICPDDLQSRMTATMRFLVFGTLPLGDIVGGVLGSALGLRTALWIAAAVGLTALAWVLAKPVRSLREIPAQDPSPAPRPAVAHPRPARSLAVGPGDPGSGPGGA